MKFAQYTMDRHAAIVTFLSIILVVLPACSTLQPNNEHLEFECPWTPTLGHEAVLPDGSRIAEFVRKGESVNNWGELVTLQNFHKNYGGTTPEELLNHLREIRELSCPGKTKWNIIKRSEKSIVYEWQTNGCLNWPAQHEIALIIDGQYNRWRLAFTAKTYQLETDKRNEWVRLISKSVVGIRSVPPEMKPLRVTPAAP